MQLAAIEKDPGFAAEGITILPIVMNARDQIQPDLDRYGITSPVLLDDGTVARAYDTLGKEMHDGLPGHSFVLIGPDGIQLWYGEYPSMWLEKWAGCSRAPVRPQQAQRFRFGSDKLVAGVVARADLSAGKI